jgi:hypothetical protein
VHDAAADHRLPRVYTGRLDLDQHLAFTGVGPRYLTHFEHVDIAVPVELHRFAHSTYDRARRPTIPAP